MRKVHDVIVKTGRIAAVAVMIGCCAAVEITFSKVVVMMVCIAWMMLSLLADER